MKLKNYAVALGLASLGLLSHVASASAASLTWTLNNVSFQDGAKATGSFDYDASSNSYSNVNISLSNGTIYSSKIFNTSNLNFKQSNRFSLCSNGSGCLNSQYLYFVFASSMTNVPTTIPLVGNSYGLTNSSGTISASQSLSAGTITGSLPTPVPFEFSPTLGLLSIGLAFGGKRMIKSFQSKK